MKTKSHPKTHSNPKDTIPEGYPVYPESEDIYNKYKEAREVDPEDISKTKESSKSKTKRNEKDFAEDSTGSDLDIPGSELDDTQELIGNEDEENNYYSLGGDDHSNLDEENDN